MRGSARSLMPVREQCLGVAHVSCDQDLPLPGSGSRPTPGRIEVAGTVTESRQKRMPVCGSRGLRHLRRRLRLPHKRSVSAHYPQPSRTIPAPGSRVASPERGSGFGSRPATKKPLEVRRTRRDSADRRGEGGTGQRRANGGRRGSRPAVIVGSPGATDRLVAVQALRRRPTRGTVHGTAPTPELGTLGGCDPLAANAGREVNTGVDAPVADRSRPFRQIGLHLSRDRRVQIGL